MFSKHTNKIIFNPNSSAPLSLAHPKPIRHRDSIFPLRVAAIAICAALLVSSP
jgi:hypothetical protein